MADNTNMPVLYLLLLACWGCGTEPLVTPHSNATGDAPPGGNALSALSFEPNRSPARVEPITAISIELPGTTPTGASPYLVEGTLSQVSLTKLKNGELTAAVAERLVPIVTRDIASGWRIRPEVPLKQGGTYTVASRLGSHGVFQVGPSDYVPVSRVWPPAGGGAIAGIYCGPLAPSEAVDIGLENGNVAHLLLVREETCQFHLAWPLCVFRSLARMDCRIRVSPSAWSMELELPFRASHPLPRKLRVSAWPVDTAGRWMTTQIRS